MRSLDSFLNKVPMQHFGQQFNDIKVINQRKNFNEIKGTYFKAHLKECLKQCIKGLSYLMYDEQDCFNSLLVPNNVSNI